MKLHEIAGMSAEKREGSTMLQQWEGADLKSGRNS